jgi:hypothetical protein
MIPDLEKEITKLEKYFKKNGREELLNELRNLDNASRRKRIMDQAILEQEITDTKKKNAEKDPVKSALSVIKEHNRMFSEQKRVSQKLSRLLHLLIEDSGKP